MLSSSRGHRAPPLPSSCFGLSIALDNSFLQYLSHQEPTSTLIMSLVVEQTLPYSATALQLEDPNRWSRLFPLIRPSVKVVELPSGQTIVVDTSLVSSKDVLIAVVVRVGNFSNKILSHALTAFATAQDENSTITTEEIEKLLLENGFRTQNGVVVVRTGSQETTRQVSDRAIEVTVVGELKLDHILSLLLSSNSETK
jgi:hypothetical protein